MIDPCSRDLVNLSYMTAIDEVMNRSQVCQRMAIKPASTKSFNHRNSIPGTSFERLSFMLPRMIISYCFSSHRHDHFSFIFPSYGLFIFFIQEKIREKDNLTHTLLPFLRGLRGTHENILLGKCAETELCFPLSGSV